MSSGDEDETPPDPATEDDPPAALTLISRHTHAFGSPDLEVSVGPMERIYLCHSFVLALQSDYVDTLLTSPAAKREQDRMRITFPDIEVSTWEKMMTFLFAHVVNPTIDDMLKIVPLYDKYHFHDGLRHCDAVLSTIIEYEFDGEPYIRRCYERGPEFAHLISIIWPLNSFPLAKPLAAKWASRCLKHFDRVDEEFIRLMLPLVINDEKTIKSMTSTFLGRSCRGMTMNDMRDLLTQEDFPRQCILRCKEIQDLDRQRSRLQVPELTIRSWRDGGELCEKINGQYEFIKSSEVRYPEYESEHSETHDRGAMVGHWRKHAYGTFGRMEDVFIEASDVFGSAWEIACPISSLDENHKEGITNEEKKVLLRWESGRGSTLIPPKRGWKIIGDDGAAVDALVFEISYSIH